MKRTNLQIEVRISDTDMFQSLLDVCRDFANDEEIPEAKRKQFANRLLEVGALQE